MATTEPGPRKRTRRKATARRTANRKAAGRKAAPRKATPRKTSPVKAPSGTDGSMTVEHKRALAVGREESRAVRIYLEALEAHRPKRGRKRTADSIRRRLDQIDADLPEADALSRVHLVQERIDLEAELEARDDPIDMRMLEEGFIAVAGDYTERKGLSYAAWRAVGVQTDVLRRAGIPRG